MPASDWIDAPIASERHERLVAASPEATLRAALDAPVGADRLTWALIALRGFNPQQTIGEVFEGENGFVVLSDTEREFVAGVGAKVWLPKGGSKKMTDPAQWDSWSEPGTVKAVGLFRTEPAPGGADGCLLITETQVQAVDESAARRFRAYWTVVYPLSVLIRRRWLAEIAQRAER